jgi:hypothetical protein
MLYLKCCGVGKAVLPALLPYISIEWSYPAILYLIQSPAKNRLVVQSFVNDLFSLVLRALTED